LLARNPPTGALTRDRLNASYKKFYVPGDMPLVVVGAVKPADARAAVMAPFGRLSGPPPPRPPNPSPPTLAGGRRDDARRSEQQAYLGLGWRTAATNEPDVYAVDLLTSILGDSPSSRLNVRLRVQDRPRLAIE